MKLRLPMPLVGNNLKLLSIFAKKTYGECFVGSEDMCEEGWMIWWREVPDSPLPDKPKDP